MWVRNLVTASALALAAVAGSTAAGAQEYVDYVGREAPELDPGSLEQDTAVLGTTTTRDPMPVTGGDLAGLAVIGLSAVGLGSVLVRKSRTRGGSA